MPPRRHDAAAIYLFVAVADAFRRPAAIGQPAVCFQPFVEMSCRSSLPAAPRFVFMPYYVGAKYVTPPLRAIIYYAYTPMLITISPD